MKPKRRKRGAFSLPAIRRREIERHALHVGAADTEDLWRWLVAWCWHNDQNVRDPVGALQLAAERMGSTLTEAEAIAVLEQADDMRQQRAADRLAWFLGVTYPQRQRLGITTIGSTDINKRTRAALRKRRRRLYHEHRRRSRGVRPRADYEANSLSRAKPWEAEGMSRRTWYRRRGTSPKPAIPPLKSGGTNGTSPKPVIFLSAEHTLVPPERKQGGFRGGAWGEGHGAPSPTFLALEGGILLTRRWIAACEKTCGLRHNGPLSTDVRREAAE
jgi:hypothetical protein